VATNRARDVRFRRSRVALRPCEIYQAFAKTPLPQAIQQRQFMDEQADGEGIAYGGSRAIGRVRPASASGPVLANSVRITKMPVRRCHAFKREAAFLSKRLRKKRPIEVEFARNNSGSCGELESNFQGSAILSNSIGTTNSRTFRLLHPTIRNQSRSSASRGRMFLVWRFSTRDSGLLSMCRLKN